MCINDPQEAIARAKIELRSGNRRKARQLAQLAASLNPSDEEPWLVLAALATPKSSIKHLIRALEINPNSAIAKKGLEWANLKLSAQQFTEVESAKTPIIKPYLTTDFAQPKLFITPWMIIGLAILAILTIYARLPNKIAWFSTMNTLPLSQVQVAKETRTPTPTFTSTPTSTFTPTPYPTLTPTYTASPLPSATSTETKKAASKPTKKTQKINTPKIQIAKRPSGVGAKENWIDIDLSSQTAHALSGDTLIKSFVVSTGTWMHPTVTGAYHIYVKYRYANMSGPGYFLPNVPYVMYFYKDYGLHGTYWHHNFGIPMSHGCINFKTSDSAWLYSFASLGTVVNIHP